MLAKTKWVAKLLAACLSVIDERARQLWTAESMSRSGPGKVLRLLAGPDVAMAMTRNYSLFVNDDAISTPGFDSIAQRQQLWSTGNLYGPTLQIWEPNGHKFTTLYISSFNF